MDKQHMKRIWIDMKKRCDDPDHRSYEKYGGLGIGYPSSWKDFKEFYQDMYTEYPHNVTLVRLDDNADYSKDNCYWYDVLNPEFDIKKYRKPVNGHKGKEELDKFFYYNGTLNDIAGFSVQYDISYITLKNRLSRGWSIERALNEPTKNRNTIIGK